MTEWVAVWLFRCHSVAMRIAMDRTGRVVIPRAVRAQAQLRPGAPLDIRVRDGVVELEPVPSPMRLVKRGRWTIAVPEKAGPRLAQEDVDAVLDDLRSRRRG